MSQYQRKPTNLYESAKAFVSYRHLLNYPGEEPDLYTINQSYFHLATMLGVPPLTFVSYREATMLNEYLIPNKRDLTRRELAQIGGIFRQCAEASYLLQGKVVDLQEVADDIDTNNPLHLPMELGFLAINSEMFDGLSIKQKEGAIIEVFKIHGWETLTNHSIEYVNQTQQNFPYNQKGKRIHIVRDEGRLYTRDPLINFFDRFFEHFLQMHGSNTLISEQSTILHPLIDELFELKTAIKARIS